MNKCFNKECKRYENGNNCMVYFSEEIPDCDKSIMTRPKLTNKELCNKYTLGGGENK